jgi:hypothetical protein
VEAGTVAAAGTVVEVGMAVAAAGVAAGVGVAVGTAGGAVADGMEVGVVDGGHGELHGVPDGGERRGEDQDGAGVVDGAGADHDL